MTHAPSNGTSTQGRLLEIFRDEPELDVDPGTPLIDEGLLDSVAFVRLLTALQRAFGVTVDVAELQLEDFSTVARIARLVDDRREVAA